MEGLLGLPWRFVTWVTFSVAGLSSGSQNLASKSAARSAVALAGTLETVTRRPGAIAKVVRLIDAIPRPPWAVPTGGNVAEDCERCYGRRAGLPTNTLCGHPHGYRTALFRLQRIVDAGR